MNGSKVTIDPARKINDDILACIMSDSPHLVERCKSLSISKQAWINVIREGFSGEMVVGLARKMRVPQKEVTSWLHTTPRTIQRYIESQEKLSPDISDRLAQLVMVFCRSNEVFKDEDKVSMWLKSPNYALGGVSPLSLMDTMTGIELVLDELGRIEHGVFI